MANIDRSWSSWAAIVLRCFVRRSTCDCAAWMLRRDSACDSSIVASAVARASLMRVWARFLPSAMIVSACSTAWARVCSARSEADFASSSALAARSCASLMRRSFSAFVVS